MTIEKGHIIFDANKEGTKKLFVKIDMPFEKNKDEVWASISKEINDNPQLEIKQRTNYKLVLRIAAVISFILVGSGIFLKTYTKNIKCNYGQHISQVLPDGSVVYLNAGSEIAYQPYWWKFNREVLIEGEGFFEVEKGKEFIVKSNNGITQILGTSFNIYARDKEYNVFCRTGKVKVSGINSNKALIIIPGQMAIFNIKNKQGKITQSSVENVLSWKANKFNFTSMPLLKVFKELERQYDVKIINKLKTQSDYIYSGYFTKKKSIEESLNLICESFDITFVKLDDNKYKVLQSKKSE
jgi:ferric-dicitrate binding protein FerR (iron transport regulator)